MRALLPLAENFFIFLSMLSLIIQSKKSQKHQKNPLKSAINHLNCLVDTPALETYYTRKGVDWLSFSGSSGAP